MLNEILKHFQDFSSFSSFVQSLETMVEKFAKDYIKEGSAKNAILDEVIQYLQSLKDTPTKE